VDPRRYPTRLARAWVAARRNVEFPKYMTFSSLLNSTAPQVPVLVVGAVVAPALAGQFFLAQRIVKGPMNWVASGVSDVNFQDAAERRRADLLGIYRRRVRMLGVAGLVPFAAMALLSPWAFALFFGAGWREAGVITQLLVPGLYAQWVFTPFTPLFVVIERQRAHLWWAVMRLVLVGAGVYAGAVVHGARGAALGFGSALLVSFVVQHVMLSRMLAVPASSAATHVA
jgi:O-antigen/teichoic acid export membrane protein